MFLRRNPLTFFSKKLFASIYHTASICRKPFCHKNLSIFTTNFLRNKKFRTHEILSVTFFICFPSHIQPSQKPSLERLSGNFLDVFHIHSKKEQVQVHTGSHSQKEIRERKLRKVKWLVVWSTKNFLYQIRPQPSH